jgi:hydroxymethylpyrimidine/phosphomethylpyrimidine kinase
MASITVVFTDNGDGTATVTSAGVAAQTVTTKSLYQALDVAKGWVQQSILLGD